MENERGKNETLATCWIHNGVLRGVSLTEFYQAGLSAGGNMENIYMTEDSWQP